jgi:hypothetical protein
MSLELVRPSIRERVNDQMNDWSDTGNETGLPRTQPKRTSPSDSRTQVVFIGVGSCLLAGSRSGEVYYFSSELPERSIDSQDAAELLSSGLFRLAPRSTTTDN